jgi:hypothetical protein
MEKITATVSQPQNSFMPRILTPWPNLASKLDAGFQN